MGGLSKTLGISALLAAMSAGKWTSPEDAARLRAAGYRLRTDISRINRWTGKPHEHKREIARRQRQEARRWAKKVAEVNALSPEMALAVYGSMIRGEGITVVTPNGPKAKAFARGKIDAMVKR